MQKNIPIIAGNWKMNGSPKQGAALADEIDKYIKTNKIKAEIIVFPPFTLLDEVAKKLAKSSIKLGAQNCAEHDSGAYTGEIAAPMLKDAGCEYVIIGHSERRQHFKESNEIIRNKVSRAHENNLKVILCVGEILDERELGKEYEVVGEQILNSLPSSTNSENTLIAYEPVWAIGTGKNAGQEEIGEMHSFINELVDDNFKNIKESIKILYGGSVKSSNAIHIIAARHVAGFLVGGASLDAEEFCKIIEIAVKKW